MEISLALGAGGSKGVSHIGVLRLLEREGFQVRAITGTSAGGIVAALYAAGFTPEEMISWLRKTDLMRLYGHIAGDGLSLFGVAGINRLLEEMLGERRFDELRIPAALTAVDLYSGREVVLKDGRVADAVLATIALPGVFPPVKWEGRFLVDGGVLDPVPVAPARALAPTKPVAAVVLSLWDGGPTETLGPATMIRNVPLLGQIARLRVAQALNIFLHSLELGSNYITELRLQIDQPDVVIRPEVGDIGLLDRVDVDELVTRGEEAGQAALPELKRAYGWRSRLSRFIKPRPEYKIRVQTES